MWSTCLASLGRHCGKSPARLALSDITPQLIVTFLEHLEHERHNTVRSRNARLAALRAFLKFASQRDVSSLHAIEQALSVPVKRFERPMVGFLSVEEMHAIIATPGTTWTSQRDHLLLSLLYNTGARVSEIITVTITDVVLDGAPCVHLHGKGRKQRAVPLWRSTVKKIRAWLRLNPTLGDADPLLPSRFGKPMSRINVNQRIALAVQHAAKQHPALTKRQISPHVVRHTAAMHLLQSGVDTSVIALWLGHESPATTHMYVEADLTMKERALARLQEPQCKVPRYRAPDSLLEFLRTL